MGQRAAAGGRNPRAAEVSRGGLPGRHKRERGGGQRPGLMRGLGRAREWAGGYQDSPLGDRAAGVAPHLWVLLGTGQRALQAVWAGLRAGCVRVFCWRAAGWDRDVRSCQVQGCGKLLWANSARSWSQACVRRNSSRRVPGRRVAAPHMLLRGGGRRRWPGFCHRSCCRRR